MNLTILARCVEELEAFKARKQIAVPEATRTINCLKDLIERNKPKDEDKTVSQ